GLDQVLIDLDAADIVERRLGHRHPMDLGAHDFNGDGHGVTVQGSANVCPCSNGAFQRTRVMLSISRTGPTVAATKAMAWSSSPQSSSGSSVSGWAMPKWSMTTPGSVAITSRAAWSTASTGC